MAGSGSESWPLRGVFILLSVLVGQFMV